MPPHLFPCSPAARGSWVRVRTGLYKDDLASVVDVDAATNRATVRLVPRLDLQAMANRVSARRRESEGGSWLLQREMPRLDLQAMANRVCAGVGRGGVAWLQQHEMPRLDLQAMANRVCAGVGRGGVAWLLQHN